MNQQQSLFESIVNEEKATVYTFAKFCRRINER